MHEEIQQWEIHPKFPAHPLFFILIGILTGLAFGYLVQNLILGAVLGLVAGAATALVLGRISRDKRDSTGAKFRWWALVPLLGLMASTVFLWAYQFIYL